MKKRYVLKLSTHWSFIRPGGLTLLFLLIFTLAAVAQVVNISGVVTDEDGIGLPGVNVLVEGTTTGTITDVDGKYAVNADKGAKLIFSFTGYASQTIIVGNSTVIDVDLAPNAEILEEVVVTGYSSQRKRDITGAVAVVDADELNKIQASSFTQKLEGRAAGVTISTSGEPGEGTTVRIRGISSFQSNDPLYVIDGVPVQDNYSTGFNPNDIESIQVLKDASAASIYGSRANNGVVIITTKKGKSGKTRVTYDAYAGVQSPVSTPDYLIIDPLDYSDYVWTRHENAGQVVDAANPYSLGRGVLPTYSFPAGNDADEKDYSYPDNIIMRANHDGTDWFDQVFDPAWVTEHNIGVSGGNDFGSYYFSTSYLDQNGTMINNYFNRISVRANTEFKAGRFKFGENLLLTRSTSVGQDGISGGNQDEQGIMTWTTLMNPLTPVYDVAGNFGGDKAPGVSNGSNPLAQVVRAKDNQGRFYRVLGNAFAELTIFDGLTARTSFGANFSNNFTGGFNFPTWENREVNSTNGWSENWSNGFNWTWTNTLTYDNLFAEKHALRVLVGYEAIKGTFRSINGGLSAYFTNDINAWYLNTGLADPGSRTVSSSGSFNALVSAFGKIDYAFSDKYLLSLTIRRDGSSNFGDEKYGIFPAFSVGWRISQEDFLKDVEWLTDLKLRYGWGITGNQNIPGGNAFDRFGGGTASTFYDINGTNTGLATGYTLTNRGNPGTKWEENKSSNIGFDLSVAEGKLNLVVDVYNRTVDGLLFPAELPGTAGTAAPAYVNIGSMENKGFDVGLDFQNRVSSNFGYDLALTFSQYKNEIISIDGSSTSFFPTGFDSRIGIVNINQLGASISSFYGYTLDGVFRTQAEVDAHATQDGAAVGRFRFKDIDSFDDEGKLTGQPDGVINDADKGVIGSPHPDFTLGFNLGLRVRNFDFTAFLFGTFGNQIFNYNRLFDTFGLFNSNVRKEVLTESFSDSNPNGSLPKLDVDDTFSQQPSSFYVEDGSYVRLKSLQLGYTFPKSFLGNTFSSLRIYVQGQNLLTFTNYSGLDPALSNFGVQDSNPNDPNSAISADLWTGFDFGNYPSSKIIMFGVNAGF
ncbi:MAG TPA: TonB-dependent receptor [Saprospiraceae bacterium]|nr:TonB-dependent receptor [Saprospiraceae bacterium]HMQ81883.1 TonB-dependent receptor [Saprospiraceae bacterium]